MVFLLLAVCVYVCVWRWGILHTWCVPYTRPRSFSSGRHENRRTFIRVFDVHHFVIFKDQRYGMKPQLSLCRSLFFSFFLSTEFADRPNHLKHVTISLIFSWQGMQKMWGDIAQSRIKFPSSWDLKNGLFRVLCKGDNRSHSDAPIKRENQDIVIDVWTHILFLTQHRPSYPVGSYADLWSLTTVLASTPTLSQCTWTNM